MPSISLAFILGFAVMILFSVVGWIWVHRGGSDDENSD